MRNSYKQILILIAIGLFLSSCLKSFICINGNGKIETEIRRTPSFDRIENSTSFDVIYKRSDTLGIRVEADENLLKFIETDVSGSSLEIDITEGSICLDYTKKPVISVSSPELSSVYNSGSGNILADYLSGDEVIIKLSGSGDISVDRADGDYAEFYDSGSGNLKISESYTLNSDITITGSGDLTISGESENAHLKISGSGNIYGGNLNTFKTSAILTGSGNLYINVENYMNALLSGSGNIYYKGSPEIDQTITGSGKIIRRK